MMFLGVVKFKCIDYYREKLFGFDCKYYTFKTGMVIFLLRASNFNGYMV